MNRLLLTIALFLPLSLSAEANQCPNVIRATENAMNKNLDLDTSILSQVLKDLLQADELHRAGKHAEAIALARAAMKLLNP